MHKYLLLITMALNIHTTGNMPLNKTLPTKNVRLEMMDKLILKGPVEINYVIDGCSSMMIYKLCLYKLGDKYAVELSIPSKPQGVLHDYNELIKEVKYYNTYLISNQKLQDLKSALVPNFETRSTTSKYWTIKSADVSFSFNDRSGNDKFVSFIDSMAENCEIMKH